MEQLPSNSHRIRAVGEEKDPEQKTVLRVVSPETKVVRRKPPLGGRIKNLLLGDGDAKGVFSYVFEDILIPAFRDMVTDSVTQGMARMIYGNRPNPRAGRPNKTPYTGGPVNYRSFSSPARPAETRPPAPVRSSRGFDQVILPQRVQAQNVIDEMQRIINEYDFVSVRDFNEMVGEPVNHIEEKHGWYDLTGARVRAVSGGYLVELPSPVPRG